MNENMKILIGLLLVALAVLLFLADKKRWFASELFQSLDRIGSIIAMLLAIVVFMFPFERASEHIQNEPPTPTPIFRLTPSPTPTSTPMPPTLTPTPTQAPTSTPSPLPSIPPDAIPLKLNEGKVEFLSPKKWTNFVFEGVENSAVVIIYQPISIEQPSGLVAGVEFEISRLSGEAVETWNALSGSDRKFPFTPPSTEQYILKVMGKHGFGKYRIVIRTPDRLDDRKE